MAFKRDYLLPLRHALRLAFYKHGWRRARKHAAPSALLSRPREPCVLIVASDLHELVGSLGDDAMMTTTIAAIRSSSPGARIYVTTASDQADATARNRGMVPVRRWDSFDFINACMHIIRDLRPALVLVIGADAIDGCYGILNPGRALIFCDLAAKSGIPVAVLGFSFSRKPAAPLRALFREADATIRFCVRDEPSLERFESFSGVGGRLVADLAFSLVPEAGASGTGEVETWIAHRRAAGDLLLGFNIHPMLFEPGEAGQVEALVEASARMLADISRQGASWLLVSHDHRDGPGDDACLEAVRRLAGREAGNRLHILSGRPGAAAIKSITGKLDGMVCGRMHLGIASLGMGTPVLGIKYQDKLEGLFGQFGLPERFMLTPHEARDQRIFSSRANEFIGELPSLRAAIASRISTVRMLAARNFDIMDDLDGS